jgi:hypothetical protein
LVTNLCLQSIYGSLLVLLIFYEMDCTLEVFVVNLAFWLLIWVLPKLISTIKQSINLIALNLCLYYYNHKRQTCTRVILGWYIGIGLKSGRVVILGHVSSVGVPKSLNIRFNWSSTSEPGNKGLPALANSIQHTL